MKAQIAHIAILTIILGVPEHLALAQASSGSKPASRDTAKQHGNETFSSLDRPRPGEEVFPPGLIKFEAADLNTVLRIYQELSGRTLIRPTGLPQPTISIESETPLTRTEALQTLDSVLAQNGIVMIPEGKKHVKAIALPLAPQESAPLVDLPPDQLPDCGTYICYIVDLKRLKASSVAPALQPFAKLPNSILAIDEVGIVILRDFSSNVRRMLQVLERMQKARPQPNE